MCVCVFVCICRDGPVGMSLARETTLTFFVMYLHISPLMSKIYLLVNLLSKLYITLYVCSSVDCFHIW